MKKIVDENVVDIVTCQGGILFARKQMVTQEKCKISFHAIDMKKMKIAPIMRGSYLHAKFGPAYRKITQEIGDYISCSTDFYDDEHTVIVYPTGECGLFDVKGNAVWSGDLLYHDSPIRSVVAEEQKLWCTVPEQNSIISYSLQYKKFYMRIGAKASNTFMNPQSLHKYGEKLYVCSTDACKIRTVDLHDFSVQDYKTFDEPIYHYIQSCNKEVVQLASGLYIL